LYFLAVVFLRALNISIEAPMELSLVVLGIFLTVIHLHKSINCLCFFLCFHVSVCHSGLLLLWSGFGSKLQSTTFHKLFYFKPFPCRAPSSTLVCINLQLLLLLFYGKSEYML